MAGSSRAHGRRVPHLYVPWLCIPWRRTIWRRPKEHFQLRCIYRTSFPISPKWCWVGLSSCAGNVVATFPASTCSDGISLKLWPLSLKGFFGWRFRRLKSCTCVESYLFIFILYYTFNQHHCIDLYKSWPTTFLAKDRWWSYLDGWIESWKRGATWR